MTDLEKVRLCAKAMEIELREVTMNRPEHTLRTVFGHSYWPILNDIQALSLVKTLGVGTHRPDPEKSPDFWEAHIPHGEYGFTGIGTWNEAIVECVAKMQKAKS